MTDYGKLRDGTPITDEMIQAWADEAEKGYDVDKLLASPARMTRTLVEAEIEARTNPFPRERAERFYRRIAAQLHPDDPEAQKELVREAVDGVERPD